MVNIKIGFAEALGFFLLPLLCVAHAWTAPTFPSIKEWPSGTPNSGPRRPLVDEWRWKWVNAWYGNTEDGVSGQQAYVWKADGTLVTYVSTFPSWTPKWCIAFAWSVWRNGANNIKRPLRK